MESTFFAIILYESVIHRVFEEKPRINVITFETPTNYSGSYSFTYVNIKGKSQYLPNQMQSVGL